MDAADNDDDAISIASDRSKNRKIKLNAEKFKLN